MHDPEVLPEDEARRRSWPPPPPPPPPRPVVRMQHKRPVPGTFQSCVACHGEELAGAVCDRGCSWIKQTSADGGLLFSLTQS